MNVLSLFDGISCGRLALEHAGIPIENYFSSEINKYAIAISEKNWPKIKQLGDVKNWRSWNLPKIDMLLAGSPCQGFSFAGKQAGFSDPRSGLIRDFFDILNFFHPKYFLLENVCMSKTFQDKISAKLGVQPISINSSLVSAQSRKRLYWCNWPTSQPRDKKITLSDIIESGSVDREKSYCLTETYSKSGVSDYLRGRSQRQAVIVQRPGGFNQGGKFEEKSPTLTTNSWEANNPVLQAEDLRKLSPEECEKLQTLPVGYTGGVSKTQRYKAIGNCWTVDVVAHLLSQIANPPEYQQTFDF